ncbi:hypothetical protein TGME49_244720 [Toxoplasma gondii ME49]|uniref:Uncharacterized protein n=1 Tax=Toxoplasma gondii (strain ATCC 50611 / Me49) TaxID=508771 RepID=S8FAB8_TOXGM|nr:hypothetical protein TGME49_244720 [Toxoplasma gondii ME49]EPT30598.1 hypothetical protein TGME49_244720 [Toxoplasma gondii ME49]|eukprot:XP_018637565.1 hypothetical protein TGME49_244720 [Toxoplasma gondii ME49]
MATESVGSVSCKPLNHGQTFLAPSNPLARGKADGSSARRLSSPGSRRVAAFEFSEPPQSPYLFSAATSEDTGGLQSFSRLAPSFSRQKPRRLSAAELFAAHASCSNAASPSLLVSLGTASQTGAGCTYTSADGALKPRERTGAILQRWEELLQVREGGNSRFSFESSAPALCSKSGDPPSSSRVASPSTLSAAESPACSVLQKSCRRSESLLPSKTGSSSSTTSKSSFFFPEPRSSSRSSSSGAASLCREGDTFSSCRERETSSRRQSSLSFDGERCSQRPEAFPELGRDLFGFRISERPLSSVSAVPSERSFPGATVCSAASRPRASSLCQTQKMETGATPFRSPSRLVSARPWTDKDALRLNLITGEGSEHLLGGDSRAGEAGDFGARGSAEVVVRRDFPSCETFAEIKAEPREEEKDTAALSLFPLQDAASSSTPLGSARQGTPAVGFHESEVRDLHANSSQHSHQSRESSPEQGPSLPAASPQPSLFPLRFRLPPLPIRLLYPSSLDQEAEEEPAKEFRTTCTESVTSSSASSSSSSSSSSLPQGVVDWHREQEICFSSGDAGEAGAFCHGQSLPVSGQKARGSEEEKRRVSGGQGFLLRLEDWEGEAPSEAGFSGEISVRSASSHLAFPASRDTAKEDEVNSCADAEEDEGDREREGGERGRERERSQGFEAGLGLSSFTETDKSDFDPELPVSSCLSKALPSRPSSLPSRLTVTSSRESRGTGETETETTADAFPQKTAAEGLVLVSLSFASRQRHPSEQPSSVPLSGRKKEGTGSPSPAESRTARSFSQAAPTSVCLPGTKLCPEGDAFLSRNTETTAASLRPSAKVSVKSEIPAETRRPEAEPGSRPACSPEVLDCISSRWGGEKKEVPNAVTGRTEGEREEESDDPVGKDEQRGESAACATVSKEECKREDEVNFLSLPALNSPFTVASGQTPSGGASASASSFLPVPTFKVGCSLSLASAPPAPGSTTSEQLLSASSSFIPPQQRSRSSLDEAAATIPSSLPCLQDASRRPSLPSPLPSVHTRLASMSSNFPASLSSCSSSSSSHASSSLPSSSLPSSSSLASSSLPSFSLPSASLPSSSSSLPSSSLPVPSSSLAFCQTLSTAPTVSAPFDLSSGLGSAFPVSVKAAFSTAFSEEAAAAAAPLCRPASGQSGESNASFRFDKLHSAAEDEAGGAPASTEPASGARAPLHGLADDKLSPAGRVRESQREDDGDRKPLLLAAEEAQAETTAGEGNTDKTQELQVKENAPFDYDALRQHVRSLPGRLPFSSSSSSAASASSTSSSSSSLSSREGFKALGGDPRSSSLTPVACMSKRERETKQPVKDLSTSRVFSRLLPSLASSSLPRLSLTRGDSATLAGVLAESENSLEKERLSPREASEPEAPSPYQISVGSRGASKSEDWKDALPENSRKFFLTVPETGRELRSDVRSSSVLSARLVSGRDFLDKTGASLSLSGEAKLSALASGLPRRPSLPHHEENKRSSPSRLPFSSDASVSQLALRQGQREDARREEKTGERERIANALESSEGLTSPRAAAAPAAALWGRLHERKEPFLPAIRASSVPGESAFVKRAEDTPSGRERTRENAEREARRRGDQSPVFSASKPDGGGGSGASEKNRFFDASLSQERRKRLSPPRLSLGLSPRQAKANPFPLRLAEEQEPRRRRSVPQICVSPREETAEAGLGALHRTAAASEAAAREVVHHCGCLDEDSQASSERRSAGVDAPASLRSMWSLDCSDRTAKRLDLPQPHSPRLLSSPSLLASSAFFASLRKGALGGRAAPSGFCLPCLREERGWSGVSGAGEGDRGAFKRDLCYPVLRPQRGRTERARRGDKSRRSSCSCSASCAGRSASPASETRSGRRVRRVSEQGNASSSPSRRPHTALPSTSSLPVLDSEERERERPLSPSFSRREKLGRKSFFAHDRETTKASERGQNSTKPGDKRNISSVAAFPGNLSQSLSRFRADSMGPGDRRLSSTERAYGGQASRKLRSESPSSVSNSSERFSSGSSSPRRRSESRRREKRKQQERRNSSTSVDRHTKPGSCRASCSRRRRSHATRSLQEATEMRRREAREGAPSSEEERKPQRRHREGEKRPKRGSQQAGAKLRRRQELVEREKRVDSRSRSMRSREASESEETEIRRSSLRRAFDDSLQDEERPKTHRGSDVTWEQQAELIQACRRLALEQRELEAKIQLLAGGSPPILGKKRHDPSFAAASPLETKFPTTLHFSRSFASHRKAERSARGSHTDAAPSVSAFLAANLKSSNVSSRQKNADFHQGASLDAPAPFPSSSNTAFSPSPSSCSSPRRSSPRRSSPRRSSPRRSSPRRSSPRRSSPRRSSLRRGLEASRPAAMATEAVDSMEALLQKIVRMKRETKNSGFSFACSAASVAVHCRPRASKALEKRCTRDGRKREKEQGKERERKREEELAVRDVFPVFPRQRQAENDQQRRNHVAPSFSRQPEEQRRAYGDMREEESRMREKTRAEPRLGSEGEQRTGMLSSASGERGNREETGFFFHRRSTKAEDAEQGPCWKNTMEISRDNKRESRGEIKVWSNLVKLSSASAQESSTGEMERGAWTETAEKRGEEDRRSRREEVEFGGSGVARRLAWFREFSSNSRDAKASEMSRREREASRKLGEEHRVGLEVHSKAVEGENTNREVSESRSQFRSIKATASASGESEERRRREAKFGRNTEKEVKRERQDSREEGRTEAQQPRSAVRLQRGTQRALSVSSVSASLSACFGGSSSSAEEKRGKLSESKEKRERESFRETQRRNSLAPSVAEEYLATLERLRCKYRTASLCPEE